MTLPNLVGCGAGKSGTTSLYYYLSQHPQIFMAPAKEVHFFSKNFDKGEAWYRSNFELHSGEPVIGEFSTSYMLNRFVPERMVNLLPKAKLLFMFRNPIERAYSNYWFSLNIGSQQKGLTFSQVIRSSEGYQKYLVSGFYYQHLSRFLKYYPPEQIYIVITENFKKDALREMALCYEFLGVDTDFQPDVNQKFNVTITPSNRWVAGMDKLWLNSKKVVKPAFMWLPAPMRRQFAIVEREFRQKMIGDKRPPMLPEDRIYLQEVFAEPNQKLADFLGQPLLWKRESV